MIELAVSISNVVNERGYCVDGWRRMREGWEGTCLEVFGDTEVLWLQTKRRFLGMHFLGLGWCHASWRSRDFYPESSKWEYRFKRNITVQQQD